VPSGQAVRCVGDQAPDGRGIASRCGRQQRETDGTRGGIASPIRGIVWHGLVQRVPYPMSTFIRYPDGFASDDA